MMDTIASGWFLAAAALAALVAFVAFIGTRKVWAALLAWVFGWTFVVSLVLNVAIFLIAKAK